MKIVRVLHVVGNMDAGGLETLIMNWYRTVDRERIQFDFLTNTNRKGFYEDEILSMGGKVYHTSFIDDKNVIKYIKDLHFFFKEHKEYTIVHGHHSALGLFYLREAYLAGVPCCISHSHIASCSKTVRGVLKRFLTKAFGKYATHHFACSRAAGEYMYGQNEDFTVINNGIDTQRFAYSEESRKKIRKELGMPNNPIIVHVGRFHDQKNHGFLIEIFQEICKKNSDIHLMLVGTGPLRNSIEKKVQDLRLNKNVHFLGVRSDVAEILCAADVFLFPSLYEGLPLTLVEAQTSGLPVICSTSVTDETRLVDDYHAIPLTESTDVWATAVMQALEKSKDRSAAYKEVREKGYDSRDVAAEMQTFYLKQRES